MCRNHNFLVTGHSVNADQITSFPFFGRGLQREIGTVAFTPDDAGKPFFLEIAGAKDSFNGEQWIRLGNLIACLGPLANRNFDGSQAVWPDELW